MVRPRPTRTDDELRSAADRVFYCADQVLGLAEFMRLELTAKTLPPRIGNAVLESFVVHARALIDFFDDDSPFPDDVVVGDFFQTAVWDPPPWSFTVNKYIPRRVNKETVHITYAAPVDPTQERVLGGDRGEPWYFGAIASAFEERMVAFRAQVPSHLLGTKWLRELGA